MENVNSAYLGEIEVETVELDNGKKKVAHAFLVEQVHNNKICLENKVQYMFRDVLLGEPGHYAAICVISDKNGRRVEAIGETTDATRVTRNMKEYPLLMAYNRAFDSAALTFLGFQAGVFYSDLQIPDDPAADPQAKAAKAEPAPAKTSPAKPAAAKTAGQAPLKPDFAKAAAQVSGKATPVDTGEPPPFPSDDDAPPESEADDSPAETGQPAEDDPFSTIITVGMKKKMKWTVRELAEKAPESLEWIANIMEPSDKVKQEQQDVCRLWIERHGGGKAAGDAENAAKPAENKPASNPAKTDTPPEPEAEPGAAADPFGVIVTVGRRKDNKWTVRELAEKDYDSLEWVANVHTANDRTKPQQEAARLWISQTGGGKVA